MMVYLIDKRTGSAGVPRPAGLAGLSRYSDGFEAHWTRVIRSLPGHDDVQIVFVNSTDAIRPLLQQVVTLVRTPWTIWMLRILAHGAPGYVELGTGLRAAQARDFSILAHAMTPARMGGRGVQIHGCNVSDRWGGSNLLQQIANAVGLPVTASPRVQTPDTNFSFEGASETVEPQRRGRSDR